ncbi:hypothetical protein CHS0354_040763 [Potamilus streckersoni]|uniref:Uncharacterized protein n=1 Tax=Potamilus streckersoni TaxID=2493646 RepID=A0AAE0VXR1_9BIVA|nr:hypothetical protein CHS0354_040763 [Potamilus streckersoni]
MNWHDGKTRFETFFKPLPREVEKKTISEYREYLKKFIDRFEAANILTENQICENIRGSFSRLLDVIYNRNGECDVNGDKIDDGNSDIINNKENYGISLIPEFDRGVEDADMCDCNENYGSNRRPKFGVWVDEMNRTRGISAFGIRADYSDVSNFIENNAVSRRPDFDVRVEEAGISRLDKSNAISRNDDFNVSVDDNVMYNFKENNRMNSMLDLLSGVDDAGISNCDENNGIMKTPNFDVKVDKYDRNEINEVRMCKFHEKFGIRKVPNFGVTIKTQFSNEIGRNKSTLLKCDKLTLCYENAYEAIFDYSLDVQKQTCTFSLRQYRNKFDSNSSMSNKGFVRHDDNDSNKIKTLRRALVDKFGYLSRAIFFQLRQANEKIFTVDSSYPNDTFQFERVKNRKEKYTYDFLIRSEQQNFILGGNYVKCSVLTIHNQTLQKAEKYVISFDSFDSYLKEVYCRGLIGCKKDHDLILFGKLVCEVSWEDIYVKFHGIVGTESKDWEWFSKNNDPIVPKEAETLKYRRHKTDQDNAVFLIKPDKNKHFFKLSKAFIFGDHDKIAKLSPSVAEATCVIAINFSECIRNYYTVLINVIGIVLNKRIGLSHEEFLEYHPMACGGSWENKPKTGYEGIRSFAGDKLGMVDKKQLKFIQLWNEYKTGAVNGNLLLTGRARRGRVAYVSLQRWLSENWPFELHGNTVIVYCIQNRFYTALR